MKPARKLMALVGAGLFGALLAPTSDAQTTLTRPRSTLTITEPTEVPGGVVLQPGNYMIKVSDNQASWNVISITDPFERQTFATVLATPHTAKDSAPHSMFVYFDTPAGQNKVLRSWWPSNDRFGQDFVYPKERAAELARGSSEQIPEMTPEMAQYESTHHADTTTQPETTASTTDTSRSTTYSSTADTTPATPTTTADNSSTWKTDKTDTTASNDTNRTATTTDTDAQRSTLPRTASPFPLLALAGAASLGLGLAVRRYAA